MNEEARDRCPECGHKLHPEELEALFRGKKLDCWYCWTPLRARTRFHLSLLAQVVVSLMPVLQTMAGNHSSAWLGFVIAAVVVAAIHLLPPGLVHGAPWVRIVSERPDAALALEQIGPGKR